MVVVPLATSENEAARPSAPTENAKNSHWVRVAAAGTLGASGVLLMSGQRRGGLAAAAAGTALAIFDQKDTVREWWERLPGVLEEVQSFLSKAQKVIEEVSTQNDRLRNALTR